MLTQYIFARAKEPSTWAGLTTVLVLLGVNQTEAQAFIDVVSAAVALYAIVHQEGGGDGGFR